MVEIVEAIENTVDTEDIESFIGEKNSFTTFSR
jgi:hypothetical protein